MNDIYIKDADISDLLKNIKAEINSGANNDRSNDRLKIVSNWNIGRYINAHLKSNKDISGYGKSLFNKLSGKLGISKRKLYLSVQFNDVFPNQSLIDFNISWTHYKTLVSVKPESLRQRYMNIILKNDLATDDLILLIKNDKDKNYVSNFSRLSFIKGIPYIYKLKNINGKSMIDAGFEIYTSDYSARIKDFDAGSLICSSYNGKGYDFNKSNNASDVLYTYKAYVSKVIDGDTIIADVDLGFNLFTTQKLRLRGIDTPEINTDDGIKAREFVLSSIKDLDFIVIKTYKQDKYSRYLADIFCGKGKSINSVIKEEYFLNKQLIDKKLAVKYIKY